MDTHFLWIQSPHFYSAKKYESIFISIQYIIVSASILGYTELK